MLSVAAPLSGKGRNEHYELTVRALDQGSPQLYSEATIRVLIGDVSTNDGVPTFIRPAPHEGASVMEVQILRKMCSENILISKKYLLT